jgi:D-alanine-D-alanine ligase
MRKLRVAVIFGGVSSEHEVSLISAKSVIENIPKDKYEIIQIGITRKGEWYIYRGETEALLNSVWEKTPSNMPAFISPDTKIKGIVVLHSGGTAETIMLDVVFPVLHGANGEDGTIQGLLTLAKIPFVGCGVSASSICMDKAMTKAICDAYGILQAKWESALISDFEKNGAAVIERIEKNLGYPVFIKPANAGSSVGISKASDRTGLYKAIDLAAKHDKKLVFEQAVTGREIECAVLGGSEPVASVCGEILPCNEFYDYDAKYVTGNTKLVIPAQLPAETAEKVKKLSVDIFNILGCKGMARMDFFIRDKDGAVLLNEPNTIPGFTSISMYPKLFAASGLPYSELLDSLIKLSFEI